jgi:signal transduction histidine kinase
VIDNLLANVRAHTPSGTPATVRVVREGEDAVLTVADLGPGIAAEDREHVFERFFRQDHSRSRDGGGSGLGLAIVTAIAEMHGGSARVVPHDGPGAIFEVRLPPAGHPGDAEAGRSGPTGSPDSAAPAGARA